MKIEIIEYTLMHNKNDVIKALRKRGYKGKTDNVSLFNALNVYRKKQKNKFLSLMADVHPDKDLIIWGYEREKNLNADGDSKVDTTNVDDIPVNTTKNKFKDIDTGSMLIGLGVAFGLIMTIRFFTK